MNFVKCSSTFVARISKTQIVCCHFLVLLLSVYLIGCSDEVRLPSAEQLAQFENAGPQRPSISVDMDRLVRAKIGGGPYRVVPDDVLELMMPTILQVVMADSLEALEKVSPFTPCTCRVSERGTITLPIVGEIEVTGKTLAQIESAVIDAYHPKYVGSRPSVVARVAEYRTSKVSISGAVENPGIYELPSDRMSLVALLMEAEGIVDEGAAFIRITHADQVVSNNKAANVETVEKADERLPEPNETELPESSVRHPHSNKIDVQLTFKQPAASSTVGGLTITYGQRTLLAEQLDITSDIERGALLERLVQREPRVSTAVVNQRLCALAEMLKPGSGTCRGENETASDNRISIAKLGSNEVESRALPERLTHGEPRISTAGAARRLYASAALPRPGYGLRNSEYITASQNIGLNAKLDTSDSEQTFAVDETLYEQLAETYEDLLEELDLKESPEIAEQVKSAKPQEPRSLVLPVKGLNIPFADVALRDGDSVIVERLRGPMITVVGLVNRAGNFPYPPYVEYNLMQALGFAGGLNLPAEPRYATVYRLGADGTTVIAAFNIVDVAKSADPTDALSVPLKPYDVVAVEHTPRTRAKVWWDRVFRFYISTYVRPQDIFGEY